MIVSTTRFGEIEVPEEQILRIPDGLLGFESIRDYCLIPHCADSPFRWLQAVHEPALAFVVIHPFDYFAEYEFEIPDADLERLALECAEDVLVLAVVTINAEGVSANLVGPVVVNKKNRIARQVVLTDPRYKTRHALCQTAKKDPVGMLPPVETQAVCAATA